MPFIADAVYEAAVAVLAKSDGLHVASREVSNASELEQSSLGMSPVRMVRSGRGLTVLPIRGGIVTAPGKATHWVLVASGQVLASSFLSESKTLGLGNAFDLDSFDIAFP